VGVHEAGKVFTRSGPVEPPTTAETGQCAFGFLTAAKVDLELNPSSELSREREMLLSTAADDDDDQVGIISVISSKDAGST